MYLYQSLDVIPYKTFLKVAATQDFSLLSDTEKDLSILELIWEELFKDHLEFESTPESKRELRITLDVEALENEHFFIINACDSLAFAYDYGLIEILRGKRYELRNDNTENYHSDITKIKRFANGLKIKINTLRANLPKEKDEKENDKSVQVKTTIDDVMCGYSDIMGFDFDYNQITYTKFKAIQRKVNLKMKAISEQNKPKK